MDIRFRLIEGPAPSGEIRASDLARISGPLHDFSIRLGRERAESTGPGRSRRSVEELSEIRLVSMGEGSTTLTFAVGPPDMLPVDLADMAWQRDEF